MNNSLLYSLAFLGIGLTIGSLMTWLYAKLKGITQQPDSNAFISKALYDMLQLQHDRTLNQLQELEAELRLVNADLAGRNQTIRHLDERLQEQKDELAQLQVRFNLEFERIANKLLEEKSQKFTLQNHDQLQSILTPLREHIKTFEAGIEKRFLEETRDRVSLKTEIEHLRSLNRQLSQDANNLASALKGDNKAQGDWGEIQLELLLQKAGLVKGLTYEVQASFTDEAGQQKRPDFIVRLPDDKNLIIDAKVSLSAYDRYCSATDEAEKQKALREHLDSLRRHIKGLSDKNYQQLYQIHTPDYLLLFVPLEPAFALAIQQDQKLFTDALERNIVLVSTSTLLATMRTVSFIWKQEKQKNSVLEIARQSGLLYDKFCTFVDDLRAIGNRLEQAQSSYRDALNKLNSGARYGDTLVGRAERIRELGAKATKRLPLDLLDVQDTEG